MRLIDLFAGCGGMTLGFKQAGFEPVFAVEFDSDAADTYELNFGCHVARATDGRPLAIEEVDQFPQADVVIGGPPCQGFSTINRDRVGLERRMLYRQFLRALEEASPEAFVLENVPPFLKSSEFDDFKAGAEALGFGVEGRVLDAADYGAATRRRRTIVIGSRNEVRWPDQTHFALDTGKHPSWKTFYTVTADLPRVPTDQDWHNSYALSAIMSERIQAVPNEGESRIQLAERRPDITPPCWLNIAPTSFPDTFGRLWWDRPVGTLRTQFHKPEKGRFLHPSEHRPITVREAARCMGFPDAPEFKFPPAPEQKLISVCRQIGNAVPPPLARAIAEALLP